MTLSEFKAWLEGFEEAMGGNPPSAEQWRTIKDKLKKVTATTITVDAPKAGRAIGPWFNRDYDAYRG